jgi:hypothetical protein
MHKPIAEKDGLCSVQIDRPDMRDQIPLLIAIALGWRTISPS